MYNSINENDIKQGSYLDILEKVQLSIFKKYDAKMILYNETYNCLGVSWKKILKLLIKCFFFKGYNIQYNLKGNKILLLYSKNYRIDHDSYWEKIKNDIKEYDEITILCEKVLSTRCILKKLYYFVKSYKDLKKIKAHKDRIYLATKLVDRKIVLNDIYSLDINPELVMCFSDNSPDENVLMQYFKQKGAITVTNQHGLCIYKSDKYDRLNQSQILNFKCDYFFARCYKQKEQLIKAGVNPQRIKVVGFIRNDNSEIKIKDNKCIGVYLDCPTIPLSTENNIKIINYCKQISNELGMKYIIKCHPQDSVERYQYLKDDNCIGLYGKNISLDETFKQISIGMSHVSATYADLYMNGIRCLKMNSDIFYPIAFNEDEFDNVEVAVNIIKKWNSYDFEKKIKYIQNVRDEYCSPWKNGNINTELENLIKLKKK